MSRDADDEREERRARVECVANALWSPDAGANDFIEALGIVLTRILLCAPNAAGANTALDQLVAVIRARVGSHYEMGHGHTLH